MKKIDARFQKYHTTLSAKAKELDLRIDGLGEPLPPHDQGDLANGSVAKEMAAAFQDIRTKLSFLIRLAIERMQQGITTLPQLRGRNSAPQGKRYLFSASESVFSGKFSLKSK